MPKTLKYTKKEAHNYIEKAPFLLHKLNTGGKWSVANRGLFLSRSSLQTFLGSNSQPPHRITWSSRTHMLFMWLQWRDGSCRGILQQNSVLSTALISQWHTFHFIKSEQLEEWEKFRSVTLVKEQEIKYQRLTPYHCETPNVCFHIATSNPDKMLICCRARTSLRLTCLYFMQQSDPMQRQRPPKKPTRGQIQGCRRGKCKYIVGGSRQGTLQQLVWIIHGVGGSRLREVEGRRGDSWRQDRASRSGRMTITKILAGSRSPAERGCSWLTLLTSYRMDRPSGESVCVWQREGRSYFHFLWDSPFLSLRNTMLMTVRCNDLYSMSCVLLEHNQTSVVGFIWARHWLYDIN